MEGTKLPRRHPSEPDDPMWERQTIQVDLRNYLRRPRTVAPAEAIQLLADGALVVDVRRRFEFERCHIPGARSVPLEQLEATCVDLPEDRLILTFCTGGLRSSAAAVVLTDHGLDAANVSRGLIGWRAAGGDLT